MFPINDTEPNRYSGLPWMTLAIILVNVIITGWEYSLYRQDPELLDNLFHTFGAVPVNMLAREGAGALAAVTSTFLHGDAFHLGSNMLALWVFGRRVEDACGSWRFLLFYLICGALATATFVFIHAGSDIPAIGASGAIFGVMGAYLLLYPGGRIRNLIFITIIPTWPRLRAIWVVLYFVAAQIIPAINVVVNEADYGTAYWAHIGGFFSAAFILLFLRPEAFQRYNSDLPI